VFIPPWVPWFASVAGSRTGNRSDSGRLPRRPPDASQAGALDYNVSRSHTEGRDANPTAASRPGARIWP
jgi:hypothetical protein